MIMPVNSVDTRPLNTFTVEQLMLIRKLKESGISKEQVAYVFDSYDHLDRELGSLYNIPIALALQAQTLQRIALHGQVPGSNSFTTSGSTGASHQYHTSSSSSSVSCATVSQATDSSRTSNTYNLIGADMSAAADEPEFQEFLSFIGRGDVNCCEEIRQFVIQHGIKQQQIAVLSGICQSYVSRFLKGDLYEMSERSRQAICKWYLKYQANPALIGPAANLASMFNSASSESSPSQFTQKNYFDPTSLDLNAMATNLSVTGLLSCQRRERFVFRQCQIEILERHFKEGSYPTPDDRAEIAAACNAALEESVGRKLSDRETVTLQIVSNWFANKRKDLKKAAKEGKNGGQDVSDLLLRSRGRPPQLFYYLGAANERDSKDYDNTNLASDDSISEMDHYNSTNDQHLSYEIDSRSTTGSLIKTEAPYSASDYSVLQHSHRNPSEIGPVSPFLQGNSFSIPLNGIDQKSSSSTLLAAGTSVPDLSFVTAASGHA